MNIIYSVCANNPDYTKYSLPSLIRYSYKIKTKFHIINEENMLNEYNCFGNVKWNFLIFEVFKHFIDSNYERMVFFDLDILISDKTPNIFDTFSKQGIYMREGHSWEKMEKYFREKGEGNKFDNCYPNYFSPGIIIADRDSINKLMSYITHPYYIGDFKGNQGIINYALAKATLKPHLIPGRWHFTRGWYNNEINKGLIGPRKEKDSNVSSLKDIYMIHYAGINCTKLSLINKDINNGWLVNHIVNTKNNIMITGSSGFLGKRLLKSIPDCYSYDIINNQDILDKKCLEKFIVLNKINVIIHLAAVADLNKFSDDISIGNKINIQGTRNIIELCRKYNIRLLFASTCCCYGNNNCHPSNEMSSLCPTEPYAKSKMITEKELENETFPYTIMRLATFYGPEMRKELAIYKIMDQIYKEKEVWIHGDGKQTRTYTHVDDISGCITTILNSPNKYNIVNCTNTESISVLDIVKECEKVCEKNAKLKFVTDREGQIFREELLNNRIKNLGYEFKFNFRDGIKNTFEWYKLL